MAIQIRKSGDELTVVLDGDLTIARAAELDRVLAAELGGIRALEIDFAQCNYITSAGIRVLLAAQKRMELNGGTLRLSHVGPFVRNVMESVGIDDIFNIQ